MKNLLMPESKYRIESYEPTPGQKRTQNMSELLQSIGGFTDRNNIPFLSSYADPRNANRTARQINNTFETIGDFIPGLSYELAKERNDDLGAKLAILDLIPGGALPKKAIKGAKRGILDEVATTGTNKTKEKTLYHATDETFDEFDINKSADGSIWFSDNKEMIEAGYDGVGKRKNVMERSIDESKLKLASWDDADKYMNPQLIQMGFDGVKYSEPGKKDITYQIFNPQKLNKIK